MFEDHGKWKDLYQRYKLELVLGKLGILGISFLFSLSTPNSALGQTCVTDIGQAFDTMESGGSVSVCVLDRSPWSGSFQPYAGAESGIFEGSLLSLLSFRPNGWQNGEANALQIKLKQVSTHVWKVLFEIDDTELPFSKTNGASSYGWARDTSAIPEIFGTMGETDARLFYCRTEGASSCRTTYKAPYCHSYTSDIPSRIAMGQESPEFILYAESALAPEKLLETFGPLNSSADVLLQSLMKHTCIIGEAKK